jgi:hypothetical protein
MDYLIGLFFVVKTVKIYFLDYLKIQTLLLTIVAMLYNRSLEFILPV